MLRYQCKYSQICCLYLLKNSPKPTDVKTVFGLADINTSIDQSEYAYYVS